MSGNTPAAAAAAANAANLMQFNPIYMYQLQMAQALQGKKSCKCFVILCKNFSAEVCNFQKKAVPFNPKL